MADTFFYFFATLTLVAALAVVVNRNAVAVALSFFVSLGGVAALFFQLDAALLGVLLVLVYAGAVVALFLFIIMLLDMQGNAKRPFRGLGIVATMLAVALLVMGVLSFVHHSDFGPVTTVAAGRDAGFFTDLKLYGAKLFTTYLLPVQVVGFLLLIAMLGVIVLSKRFDGLEDIK
jgi:NADH-quinone oxidoreductase subunit J